MDLQKKGEGQNTYDTQAHERRGPRSERLQAWGATRGGQVSENLRSGVRRWVPLMVVSKSQRRHLGRLKEQVVMSKILRM
jgi:hypothetical protein